MEQMSHNYGFERVNNQGDWSTNRGGIDCLSRELTIDFYEMKMLVLLISVILILKSVSAEPPCENGLVRCGCAPCVTSCQQIRQGMIYGRCPKICRKTDICYCPGRQVWND